MTVCHKEPESDFKSQFFMTRIIRTFFSVKSNSAGERYKFFVDNFNS